jgi:hypothetical protein
MEAELHAWCADERCVVGVCHPDPSDEAVGHPFFLAA